MATVWEDIEVELKEGVGEQEAVPSPTDTSRSEEGWRWEKGDNAVDNPSWELPPDPRVHPWLIMIRSTAATASVGTAE